MFCNSFIAVFYCFEQWLEGMSISPNWRGVLLASMFGMVLLFRPLASVLLLRRGKLAAMAIHQFFRKIAAGAAIQQFGDGGTRRDYTFVQDIISGVRGAIDRQQGGPFEIYNLGNSDTIMLRDLIAAIEEEIGKKAIIDLKPEQPGDVPQTFADVSKAGDHFGYRPTTSIREGLTRFHDWIRQGDEVAS